VKPLAECKLYTFVDTAYLNGRAPELIAQQLCDGGSDLIQLRAKNSSPEEIRAMAEKILPITKRANVGLVINDYDDIARELDADFCHLGQEDFFNAGYKSVIELWGMERVLRIGLSTHSPEQAKRAVKADADYIAIGPVFATGTKPDRQTRDTRLCPLGGGKCHGAVVCHRRHKLGKSRRCSGGGRKAHLRRLGNSQRTGRGEGLRGIPATALILKSLGWLHPNR